MSHEIEEHPRMASMLPHPDLPETFAVSAITGTLPGLRIDTLHGLTQERIALVLAKTVNGDGQHGVDYAVKEFPCLSLYRLQRPAHADLAPPYQWLPCDINSIKAAYARSKAERLIHAHRRLLEEPAMKALAIFTLNNFFRENKARDYIQTFFGEQEGMYGLPFASGLEI